MLAGVTVASVRSANRAARVAEQSLLAGQRPLLVASSAEDPAAQGRLSGRRLVQRSGRRGRRKRDRSGRLLRHLGSQRRHRDRRPPRLAPHPGARARAQRARHPASARGLHDPHARPLRRTRRHRLLAGLLPRSQERRLPRGSSRGRSAPTIGVDILYGDFEGGQRVISRFMLTAKETDGVVRWYASVGRHWNVDRPDPRERED